LKRRRFLQTIGSSIAVASLSGCSLSKTAFLNTSSAKQNRLYVDGLSFIPNEHIDIKASQINAFIADISAIEAIELPDGSTNYKRTYKACMQSIKKHLASMTDNPDIYLIAKKGSDIKRAQSEKKCAIFMQIQGADCIEGGFHQLDEFHDLGLRALQLTHHYDNDFAGGALSQGNQGLTSKGIQLIERLEQKRMIIDLSHSTVASAEDTLSLAKGPIVQTHGAARAIIDNARCTPDHVIKAIADSGGVFGVFMMSWWLTYNTVPRAEDYILHLKHVKNIAGAEAVAIANDYPLRGHEKALASGNNNQVAIEGYESWWHSVGDKGILGFDREVNHIVIPELNHIKRMRSIEHLLSKAKFTSDEIDKVMGNNWQRVLTDVLG
jgi:microsomal dipeptidase-like Zn-dependent dipeptidase